MNDTITFANIVENAELRSLISEKLLLSLASGAFRDFKALLSSFIKDFHNFLANNHPECKKAQRKTAIH